MAQDLYFLNHFCTGHTCTKSEAENQRMIHHKICFEMTINYVSTTVFAQREPKEHLVEKEMSDAPKHCIQNLFR